MSEPEQARLLSFEDATTVVECAALLFKITAIKRLYDMQSFGLDRFALRIPLIEVSARAERSAMALTDLFFASAPVVDETRGRSRGDA